MFDWKSYALMLESRLFELAGTGNGKPLETTVRKGTKYYTIKDYCKVFKVTDWYVRHAIKTEKLKAEKRGRKYVIEVTVE